MLRIRIVGLAAAVIVALAGTATAQSATNDQPGKPLALLAGLSPPHTTKSHVAKTHATKGAVHTKNAEKKITRVASANSASHRTTKLASKHNNKIAAVTATASWAEPPLAPSAAPANDLPIPDAAPQADVAAAAPAEPVAPDNTPNTVVVGGETVQITSPDQINEIDLAADNDANKAAAPSDHADATPVAQGVFAAPAQKEPSPVGSASWIAQVLAALGGAATAGTVAWFLIGGGPQRMYG
jgi:hypothetical protein